MNEKLSDQWHTPQWLFDELNKEFNFDIDLCATKENSKCVLFCIDYLKNEVGSVYNTMNYPCFQEYLKENLLRKGTCFMNPPYSNPKPFIEKAWEDSKHCRIVCLVKCDPSTRWWATFWNYEKVIINIKCYTCNGYGDRRHATGLGKQVLCWFCKGTGEMPVIDQYSGPKPGCEIRFFSKRIKFDPPAGLFEKGKKTSGPTFSSALIIMDRRYA